MNLWITLADIRDLYRIPAQRIYWLAHRDRWRRTRTRPVGYWADDVTRTMSCDTRAGAT